MRLGIAGLISVGLTLLGCEKTPPAACMVNADCPQLHYCDAPPVMQVSALCALAQGGVCRAMDDSTYNAACMDDRDCKLEGVRCEPQTHTCGTFTCITDPGFVVRPEDCRPDCKFGRRNSTCAICFCPSCQAIDGASADAQ